MRKCRRKLKLFDFAWYFVVLTSGFYLTALTTVPHPGRFTGKKPSAECRTVGGKQNRGKLASCMFLLRSQCHRGQKHCSPKKTKTKKKKEGRNTQQEEEAEIVAYLQGLPDETQVKVVRAPRDCGRF